MQNPSVPDFTEKNYANFTDLEFSDFVEEDVKTIENVKDLFNFENSNVKKSGNEKINNDKNDKINNDNKNKEYDKRFDNYFNHKNGKMNSENQNDNKSNTLHTKTEKESNNGNGVETVLHNEDENKSKNTDFGASLNSIFGSFTFVHNSVSSENGITDLAIIPENDGKKEIRKLDNNNEDNENNKENNNNNNNENSNDNNNDNENNNNDNNNNNNININDNINIDINSSNNVSNITSRNISDENLHDKIVNNNEIKTIDKNNKNEKNEELSFLSTSYLTDSFSTFSSYFSPVEKNHEVFQHTIRDGKTENDISNPYGSHTETEEKTDLKNLDKRSVMFTDVNNKENKNNVLNNNKIKETFENTSIDENYLKNGSHSTDILEYINTENIIRNLSSGTINQNNTKKTNTQDIEKEVKIKNEKQNEKNNQDVMSMAFSTIEIEEEKNNEKQKQKDREKEKEKEKEREICFSAKKKYRLSVIYKLPSLTFLDGEKITKKVSEHYYFYFYFIFILFYFF
jgi:hypothetical protein